MDQERIGKFIAALRKEKGMTQEQLAESMEAAENQGYYGVNGFEQYDLLAVCADETYGFVYALDDADNRRIIYVEIIFCNYFMDLDYEEYIDKRYLPEGFDASRGNAYREKRMRQE